MVVHVGIVVNVVRISDAMTSPVDGFVRNVKFMIAP
jgi:hypothetical protein